MKWTKEPPTKPGWYWWRYVDAGEPERVLRVEGRQSALKAAMYFGWRNVELCYGEWAGPIPEPSE